MDGSDWTALIGRLCVEDRSVRRLRPRQREALTARLAGGQSHLHTNTHRGVHTHTHTHTHVLTHAASHTNTNTPTHTHAHAHAHVHMGTHTRKEPCMPAIC